MDELLACQKCGNQPRKYKSIDNKIWVECVNDCPLNGISMSVEDWNRRVPDPRLIEAVREITGEVYGGLYMQNDIREYKNQAYKHCIEIIFEHFPELKERKE